jgi:uncharacterized membrane protein YraQ (UPF0718 family)
VLAVLVAGPAINAPSLFVLARRVSMRGALATGAMVYGLSVGGGLLLSLAQVR